MGSNVFKIKRLRLAAMMAPGLLIYTFVVLMPLCVAIRYSLYKWSGGVTMTFLGLDNYTRLLRDMDFWSAFSNNIKLVVLVIIFQLGIAFLLAILINAKRTRFQGFHRFAIFLPVVVAPVVVSILWKMIYAYDNGLLDTLLRSIGLEGLIVPWLDDPKYAIYSVSVVIIWQYIGIYLVIFMAGLQSISQEIYEVALLDGANAWHRVTKITLPLMINTIVVAVMLSIAGNMKVFDHVFIMTGGGPGKASNVMAMYAYTTSFKQFQYGYSSAISVGILILSLCIVLISRLPLIISRRRNKGEDLTI